LKAPVGHTATQWPQAKQYSSKPFTGVGNSFCEVSSITVAGQALTQIPSRLHFSGSTVIDFIGSPYGPFIAVVKKPLRLSKIFCYNHLYHPSVLQNLFLKSSIFAGYQEWDLKKNNNG
jgi:hypothetical protein